MDHLAAQFGGRRVDEDLFHFPSSLGETARKTAEAASVMHGYLMENSRELYGITVLVAGGDGDSAAMDMIGIEPLILGVSDENGLWVVPDILDDFKPYLEGGTDEGLFRMSGLKEAGPRLEERLPRLLVRPDRLRVTRQALERLEREENDRTILLIRGQIGSGKRATLKAALHTLYPDDGGAPLVIPFAEDSEDPMEPFLRSLGTFLAGVPEYLDDEERGWWEAEGADFLERCRLGRIWETSRDQGPVDLIQAFTLYVKAHVERRRRGGRPAYLVVDAFTPNAEAVTWLRSLLNEFLGRESFRLIIIRDSDDFDEVFPLPGKGHEVTFRAPGSSDWEKIIREAALSTPPGEAESADMAERCGADLYTLFHSLLALERGYDKTLNPGEALVSSLDRDTRRLLFLCHAASGLADRSLLISRVGDNDELMLQESARYDGLVDYGLIREDVDGRVRFLPDGPENAVLQDLENIREAERFGSFLFSRFKAGDSIDLYRLYRYLEQWGPASNAVAVLDGLLEALLTNRRLRAAGLLLNGPPMARSDLDGPDMEALQNVVGAARLRYVLLTGDAESARTLVRDGTVSLISARGAYSDRFRLHNARFSYAISRWDDALTASKEALFTFQKSGDHSGETHSHLELALSLLAVGKLRDALEHFGIARRIGTQVSASWGVLRSAAMEAVAQFLFGNLPRASRECTESRQAARREGRRDLWLLLTLTATRIAWELGRYDEAASLAEEGRRTARFYSLNDEESVMKLWKGRSQLAAGNPGGRQILEEADSSREAQAFLAEAAYMTGDESEARERIRTALSMKRQSCRLQGEADDWSDGYFPIEGRLADSRGALDILGERIEAFDAFLSARAGETGAVDRIIALLEKDGRRIPRPFSYQYALWAAMVVSERERETRTRFMSRGFNDLQVRAGRFDDNQTKHSWLTANPWNKLLMEEAHRLKFL
ncbi:MAG: hypothetical protein P1P77_00365 [Spirochaetaceae bacterium]|nr:hypothetical protein [Spirochaetaceae bacterium]